jgi:membrane fusion protein (multidrug efflux system)
MSSSLDADRALDLLAGRSPARFRSRVLRPVLMAGGVAAVLAGGLAWWLHGGRYVSVDDAYLRAAKLLVATDVSGIVARVNVHEGQTVHRGETLLELDAKPFRITLDGARAALAQTALDIAAMKRDYQHAQRDIDAGTAQMQSDREHYQRFAGLVHGGAVTQAETDDARFKLAADEQSVDGLRAQAQMLLAKLGGDAAIDAAKTPAYQQAQSRVDEAQRELAHTRLIAPFDGVVTQVENVQPGMYLGAASPAFALVSSDDIWAEGNPKETELTWVVPGQHVSVHVDTYPGRDWSGVVESISPAAGSEFSVLPAQNTSGNWVKVVQRIPLRVRLEAQKDAPALRAGMSVVLDIDTGHTRHLSDLLP